MGFDTGYILVRQASGTAEGVPAAPVTKYQCPVAGVGVGRERRGQFWGYLAGWSFVVGKTASCAAMALTVGFYVWPQYAHAVAVAAVWGTAKILGVRLSLGSWD